MIDYDDAFASAAVAMGAIPAGMIGGKRAVRDRLRSMPGGEAAWTRLQARIYGPEIGRARLFPGVAAFLAAMKARDIPVAIVSHKTEFAAAGGASAPNLRMSALAFLAEHGIDVPVYFESTRPAKCSRIAALRVTHVVDDLVEVFTDEAFPTAVERWLFAPHGAPLHSSADRVFASWSEILAAVIP